jgi:hypothetical protein
MPWHHVVHRFQLNRVDLKTARPSVDEASKLSGLIFSHSTETPLSIRDETLPEAELTMRKIIPTSFEKHALPKEAFGLREGR